MGWFGINAGGKRFIEYQFPIVLVKVPLKLFGKTLLLSHVFKFIFCVSLTKIWKNSEN